MIKVQILEGTYNYRFLTELPVLPKVGEHIFIYVYGNSYKTTVEEIYYNFDENNIFNFVGIVVDSEDEIPELEYSYQKEHGLNDTI